MKMRRTAITVVAVGALLLTLTAGAALAKTFTCSINPCEGTRKADVITGTNARDVSGPRPETTRWTPRATTPSRAQAGWTP